MVKRGRPTKKEKKKDPANRCDGRNKFDKQCGKEKGWGTTHYGRGYCKYHDDAPSNDVLIDIDDLDNKIDAYIQDPNIFDLRKNLAILNLSRDYLFDQYKEAVRNGNYRAADALMESLKTTILQITAASEKFFKMVKDMNFALTVAQAKQIRDQMVKIIGEETRVLKELVEPIEPQIATDLSAWQERISYRFNTELQVENDDKLKLS